MPLIENDTGAEASLEELGRFIESCGGTAGMISGWRTELYGRSTGHSAGTTDRRALGLEGAPAMRVKGLGDSRAALAPGERPATWKFGEEKEPAQGEGEKEGEKEEAKEEGEKEEAKEEAEKEEDAPRFTFEEGAELLRFEGDFLEFDPEAALEAPGWKQRTMPKRWRNLAENVYVWPAHRDNLETPPLWEWPRCDCTTEKGGCGLECINKRLYMECPLGFCRGGGPKKISRTTAATVDAAPSGRTRRGAALRQCAADFEACANTVLQCRRFPPCEIFDTGAAGRGFGLRCLTDVDAGTALGEYRGEVIVAAELANRRSKKPPDAPFYFAALGDGLFIDAESKGAYARFANHSCAPNCQLQKWTVGNEPRLALVALRPIKKYTELTYDYNAGGGAANVTHAQSCNCGAPNCAGSIGGKADPNAVPVDTFAEFSDDDDIIVVRRGLHVRGARKKLIASSPEIDVVDDVDVVADVDADADDADDVDVAPPPEKKIEPPEQPRQKGNETDGPKLEPPPKKKRGRPPKVPRVDADGPGETLKKKPRGRPPKAKHTADDGPLAKRWALETLGALTSVDVSLDQAPLELAFRLRDPAVRAKARQLPPVERHCFCRQPEDAFLPAVRDGWPAAVRTLVCCDRCDSWYHAGCLRMVEPPTDDDPFVCALCRWVYDRDPAGLQPLASNGCPWQPSLSGATLDAARAALDKGKKLCPDAGDQTRLALDFLASVVDAHSEWIKSATDALTNKNRVDELDLARLVCQGDMLDLASDLSPALSTGLRDALAAALAVDDVEPSPTSVDVDPV